MTGGEVPSGLREDETPGPAPCGSIGDANRLRTMPSRLATAAVFQVCE